MGAYFASRYRRRSANVTGTTWAWISNRGGTFDPLLVARPVNRGGRGAVELALRCSNTGLTDGTVDGGEMDIFSLSVNRWFVRSTHLGVNYRYITLDRVSAQGDSSGLNARILLKLD